jgi:hypothetical protein
LGVVEHRVDATERAHDRDAELLGAVDAHFPTLRRTFVSEGRAFEGVREGGDGALMVDLGLGPLGLQLVQDARELFDLGVGELEFVGEKAQGPSHSERAAAEGLVVPSTEMGRVVVRASVMLAVAPRRIVTTACSGSSAAATVLGVRFVTFAVRTARVLPPIIECRMHGFSSRRSVRIRRGS